jgi:type II secretory pathway pseudopilin PulG
MNPRQNAAFTWVEALVCLAVIGILLALALPSGGHTMKRGEMTQSLSNMRQLHLATQQMALDGESSGDRALGWPGDTGGTFSSWVTKLVPEYLGTNDFCKLLSGPGVVVPSGKLPSTMRECAVRVYAVGTNSPETAVFLTSANFTNTPGGGAPLEKSAKPYGDKGFVVFRKGGDGAILLKTQVGKTNLIGSFVPLLD